MFNHDAARLAVTSVTALEHSTPALQKSLMRGLRLVLLIVVAAGVVWYGGSALRDAAPPAAERVYGGVARAYSTSHGVLQARLYAGSRYAPGGDLVVLLHGDAPSARPGYQYRVAAAAAAAMPDAAFLALLRPGYTDPMGRRSAGRRGLTTGDNYTADRVEALEEAIKAAAGELHARRVVLAGHSGGAALTALLLARHPELSRLGLLVACPCDLPAWRTHMALNRADPLFLIPNASLDPKAEASRTPTNARIVIIGGETDDTTPLTLSRAYAASLPTTPGIISIPGDHEIFDRPEILAAIARLLAEPPNLAAPV